MSRMPPMARGATLSAAPSESPRRLRYLTPEKAFAGDKVFRLRPRPSDWTSWVRHLGNRRTPSHPNMLVPGKDSCLGWALPERAGQPDGAEFALRLAGVNGSAAKSLPVAEELAAWLAESADRRPDAGDALEVVAVVHALPRLVASVPQSLWWELLDHALALADRATALSPLDDPVAQQLAAGELPLTLRYLFPEIGACHRLLLQATEIISEGLVELLDGEGLPHCSNLPSLRPLLACWTRCQLMLRELPGASLTRDAQEQYEWLVRQALRLTRADGSQLLSNGAPPDQWSALFAAALDVAGDQQDRAIAKRALPGGGKSDKQRAKKLPEPSLHSEWAATALLRSDWSRNSPRLLTTYDGCSVVMEVEADKTLLFSGVWKPAVEVDGRSITLDGAWSQTCWYSDDDVDYLELEVQLEAGWKLQRHLLLARLDRFLFLADAVLGGEAASLAYRGFLPVPSPIAFRAQGQTWEATLVGRNPRALIMPLGLPEWRQGTNNGSMRMLEEGLQLKQSADAPALFAPLFIDLEPRRFVKPLTWRQLTVAENLEIQPPHVAVAYRVQSSKKQWLFYRSLAPAGNRTVLGHNLCTEFLCGRLDRSGGVTQLVEIE